jgi:hypothetical protein
MQALLLFSIVIFLMLFFLFLKPPPIFVSVLFGLLLAFSSGLRPNGYDYDNYVTMFDAVRDGSNDIGLFYAKDLFIFVLLKLISFRTASNEYWPFFLGLCLTSSVIKIFAFNVGRRAVVYLWGFYIIFLSPTLEFSAMRSSIAIAFLLLLLHLRNCGFHEKITLASLSVASHLSLLPSAIVCLPSSRYYRSNLVILSFLVLIPVFFLASDFILSTDRGVNYSGNYSTIYGFILPIGVLLAHVCSFITNKRISVLDVVVFLNLSLVFGLLPYSVGISHRYMEVCMVLILYKIFTPPQGININYLALFVLLATASIRMMLNGAWSALLFY